jgi:hypothetical protein
MKLRLRENSVRLRLLQTEVAKLQENGSVSEQIRFGQSQNLTYTLKASDAAEEISAYFSDGEMIVEVPAHKAQEWATGKEVGLQKEQKVDDALTLKILIEKDFVCLERPADADNADAFPHPKMNC